LWFARPTPRDDACAACVVDRTLWDGPGGFQAVLESGSGQYPPAGFGAAQQRPGVVSPVTSREDA